MILFFFFKQKTAYEVRISDWSSDVCSSDLGAGHFQGQEKDHPGDHQHRDLDEIVEEVDWPDQLLCLFQQGPGRLEAGSREPSWKEQILRPEIGRASGRERVGQYV